MGISNLWKRELFQDGTMGVVDAIWLTVVRLNVFFFFIWLILLVFMIIFVKRTVDRGAIRAGEIAAAESENYRRLNLMRSNKYLID